MNSALILASLLQVAPGQAPPASDRFELLDVFALEWVSDPRISPDGAHIVYTRNGYDIMKDQRVSDLWTISADGSGHRPLVAGDANVSSARWSPDGTRLLYTVSAEGATEIHVRWLDTGQAAPLASLPRSPGDLSWSPDGEWIAFTMMVPEENAAFVQLRAKPDGADWGPPIEFINEVIYRRDGAGYVEPGHRQVFLLPAVGGSPRQLTTGPYDHSSPVWTSDGRALLLSANRHADAELNPGDTEIYEISVEDGQLRALTDRRGPDNGPAISPDGQRIAYTGYDDRYQGYQVTRLYIADRDGSNVRMLGAALDRSIGSHVWGADNQGLYFEYTDEGESKIGYITLDDEITTFVEDMGGSVGRPYSGGSFTASQDGRFAYTLRSTQEPANLAVAGPEPGASTQLTRLNDDLFGHKQLGAVEEIWYESSHDGRRVQGWIITPPGFDPAEDYPLVLEIHGGPFSSYGPHFTAEGQLYAAAGYVVLYTNPRGSTSYGEEFGNLIHHAYPSHDFDDLMSGVDAVIERGFIDADNLFVTGGSGGGVLSAWIVGHTDRFRAAVVQKPVINWYSWALTADMYVRGVKYWFPGPPWEHTEHYMARSPISYIGNVTTPTMLITGEVDYRTPIWESEQFYQALKLRGVPAALVRVPDASHGISSKPSNLIGKVAHILGWFNRYRTGQATDVAKRANGGGGADSY